MAAGTKPVIGLVGGVAAGKSTVAAELAALGCAIVDADAIGHEALHDPAVKAELVRAFGRGILLGKSGTVDRQALARRVFGSPAELERLNAVMHPRMRARLAERIAQLSAEPSVPAVVVDAAVLLEAGWDDLCTQVVFVSAPADQRRRRAVGRGWSPAEWQRRENSQNPLDRKRAGAENVIDNSSSLAFLREQVRSFFHRVTRSADRPKDRS